MNLPIIQVILIYHQPSNNNLVLRMQACAERLIQVILLITQLIYYHLIGVVHLIKFIICKISNQVDFYSLFK